MPVTNEAQPEPTQDDFDRLHYLVTHLVEAAFDGEPTVITTDRTGKVDAAWVARDGDLEPVAMQPWLAATSDKTREFTLMNLGGMLRLYAEHPRRNPLVSVVTYPEWPAMVEVHLYE